MYFVLFGKEKMDEYSDDDESSSASSSDEAERFEFSMIGGVDEEALSAATNLQSLDCGGCGDEGARLVAEWMLLGAGKGGGGNLRVLSMRRSRVGAIIGEEGATAIARAISISTSLEELDLGCNRMGASGCIAIVNALEGGNSSLRSLDLTGAPIPFAHSMCTVRSNGVLRLGLPGAQAIGALMSRGLCSTLVMLFPWLSAIPSHSFLNTLPPFHPSMVSITFLAPSVYQCKNRTVRAILFSPCALCPSTHGCWNCD